MDKEMLTMRLAITDDEAQTVVDALIDYVKHRSPDSKAANAWTVIAEMAVQSHNKRKAA
jgi:hypothetical protein